MSRQPERLPINSRRLGAPWCDQPTATKIANLCKCSIREFNLKRNLKSFNIFSFDYCGICSAKISLPALS
jgi:hypothetical protein